ncbi:uncharacterized protein DUF4272 [Prosthecobacter fusiformis]|uniref:Uncharacterized protein DUF4272 n=1 Tax=Prosthecobacter fusiformis TaxID=48464 RepID=A0A4R7SRS0_9BACT|nr:uncharacterized protein DUF4272 [Prosthecobacter fusiformis]
MNINRLEKLAWAVVFLPLAFTPTMSQTAGERKIKIEQHEATSPSVEAASRKIRSIERLKKEGVATIDHLPVIEDSQSCRERSAEEIARRAIAVCITAVKGEGLDQAIVETLVKKYGAEAFFTPMRRPSSKTLPLLSKTGSTLLGAMNVRGYCCGL